MKEKNPFILFQQWFKDAENHPNIEQANAVNLATSTSNGFPSSRIVLIKDYNEEGFVFYTNLESRKGIELKNNPRVALCFYWEPLGTQIRIEGNVRPVTNDEADDYFSSRPINSQLGAWASQQSHTMEKSLASLRKEVTDKVENNTTPVKRPPYWSGFRVIPTKIEFWQDGGISRLHDRTLYVRSDTNSDWVIKKLYP
ncbi:MAG: pyridoxamine 5'-phosphate oxidase [Rickettsiales bacterium]|jgi:pyridoxamine 5'-phosphate oxidase|nr:pyridoxamine 5'-phosphate oxidase [Rickettsiales bacterium]